MIGKEQLILDAKQFMSGIASSDYSPDGGLGTSSVSINPFTTPGLIRSTVAATDKSTNLVGNMIASSEDSQVSSADNRLFVDDAANYYTCNSAGTLTKRVTGTGTTHYVYGKTDMAAFALNTYVTRDDDIDLYNNSAHTITNSWWVGTKSQSALATGFPHPMLVFEGFLWVADKNNLHQIDSSGNVVTNVLALNSSELIYALGIDPQTGLMLVSVQTAQNISNTLSTKYFVYLYDGYSTKPRRKIVVTDMVTAFYPVGGTVFVGYGQSIGYWNGNGISFLRKLLNVSNDSTQLIFKHHLSHVNRTLLYVDGSNVVAYGEVVAGQRGFFHILQNTLDTHAIGLMTHIGNNVVGVATSTSNSSASSKFYISDISSTSTGTGTLYFNNIYFPRPIWVRRVRIFTTALTTGTVGGFTFFDEKGAQATSQTFNISAAETPKYMFDFDYGGYKLQVLQPRVSFSAQGFGVAKIIIYYDVAE